MRARNMQTLTDDVQRRRPGVVIYGLGDAAHAAQSSDHNEDDTAGRRTPQTDSDNVPEHRAVDVMLGPRFSAADGHALVAALLGVPANRARLSLVIYAGFEYSRRTGFAKVARTSDRHDDHVHVSGLAADDNNTAPWILNGDHDMTGYMDDTNAAEQAWRIEALFMNLPATRGGMNVGKPDGENKLFQRLSALEASIADLRAMLSAPAPVTAELSQEQVDAAVAVALSAARFDTRVTLER